MILFCLTQVKVILLYNKNGYSMIPENIIEEIKEENFCLKFELDSLAELLIRNESERMIPGFSLGFVEHDHKERYNLILDLVKDKEVLDIACGAGYGAYLMATEGNAKCIYACDINEQTIKYAKYRYKNKKINYLVQNAENLNLTNKFDVAVSFETIEHLVHYNYFLESIRNRLKSDGIFIVSTPLANKEIDCPPSNPYHVQEWNFKYFQHIISQYFTIEKIYVQLYQNEVVNESIKDAYFKDKTNIIKYKIKKYLLRKKTPIPNLHTDWNSIANYSVISEFNNQFDCQKLGTIYKGYQIIICKNNEK